MPTRERHRASRALAAAAILMALSAPDIARSELVFTSEPPGLRTASGSFEANLDAAIGAEGYLPHGGRSGLMDADVPFAIPTAALGLDIFAGGRVRAGAELVLDGGAYPEPNNTSVRLEQAWISLQPLADQSLRLRLGLFVTPFGDYPQRHDTTEDPFLRPPLSYDYRTMICAGLVPLSNDGFLSWRDRPEQFRPSGAPPIWDAPYQVGVMASGSAGPLGYRLALMGSAPSSEPEQWLAVPGGGYPPSIVAGLSARIGPAWRAGLSFASSAYMTENPKNEPPGFSLADYRQTLIGAGAFYTRGWTVVRGEIIHDTWQVPNTVDDPVDISWYLEVSQKLAAGIALAVRYGSIHFLEMARSAGGSQPWDYDAQRWQAALDWRVSERLRFQMEYGRTATDSPYESDGSLLAARATFRL